MSKLTWDDPGKRFYETGVDNGVLYPQDANGAYPSGVAWNGITTVTESPSGAEPTPIYADNIKYLNLMSAENFGATIEAYTYPDEFAQCDGTAVAMPGVSVAQQARKSFGFCYRTKVGNDILGNDYGSRIHLVYGALASPSEKSHATINDSPEALTLSWSVTTTPIDVPGYKPSAHITIDTATVPAAGLASLLDLLYGTAGTTPQLPTPAVVFGLLANTAVQVTATAPTMAANVITIPTVTGVTYKIDGVVKTGVLPAITADTVVKAYANTGYKFAPVSDDDWFFKKV